MSVRARVHLCVCVCVCVVIDNLTKSSAPSLSSFIACPVFGYFSDWTRNTKLLFLICNLFEVVGNFLYMVKLEWVVILTRFICGIGSGIDESQHGFRRLNHEYMAPSVSPSVHQSVSPYNNRWSNVIIHSEYDMEQNFATNSD